MKSHKWSRRTFYLAAVVAIVASTSGFALASVLSAPTTITQNSAFYSTHNHAPANWGTPMVQVSQSEFDNCNGSIVTEAVSGSQMYVEMSADPGVTSCATNDFAEEFSVNFNGPVSTQANNFTVYSQVTNGTVQVNYVTVVVGAGGPVTPFITTLNLFVDYGSVAPPPSGIALLELVIH